MDGKSFFLDDWRDEWIDKGAIITGEWAVCCPELGDFIQ